MPISSPLPEPGDPVGPAEAKVDAFLREVRTKLNADTSVLPSLPSTADDGEICHVMLDESRGVVGSFRYRATSSSPYKWENVSGVPLLISDIGPRDIGATPTSIVLDGWVAPWDGEYQFSGGAARIAHLNSAPVATRFGLTLGSAPGVFFAELGFQSVPPGNGVPLAAAAWTKTVSAGSVVRLAAVRDSIITCSVSAASLSITPVRVAG